MNETSLVQILSIRQKATNVLFDVVSQGEEAVWLCLFKIEITPVVLRGHAVECGRYAMIKRKEKKKRQRESEREREKKGVKIEKATI